jgi:hypothetical protein
LLAGGGERLVSLNLHESGSLVRIRTRNPSVNSCGMRNRTVEGRPSVKALSLMCDDGVAEKALLFGFSYSLDELESGDGNGGKPSSSRNSLCLIVAFWIVFSIFSNTP